MFLVKKGAIKQKKAEIHSSKHLTKAITKLPKNSLLKQKHLKFQSTFLNYIDFH